MDFAFDDTTVQFRKRLRAFMNEHVYPAEPVLADYLRATSGDDWSTPPVITELRARARAAGWWNLFLPGPRGAGLTNLQYAPLAEVTGRGPALAPVAVNCAAPDTGNIDVLEQSAVPSSSHGGWNPCWTGEFVPPSR